MKGICIASLFKENVLANVFETPTKPHFAGVIIVFFANTLLEIQFIYNNIWLFLFYFSSSLIKLCRWLLNKRLT